MSLDPDRDLLTRLIRVLTSKVKEMKMFQNKKLLITGGTGSFGNAVLKRFISSDIEEIRIFSRDEKNKTI